MPLLSQLNHNKLLNVSMKDRSNEVCEGIIEPSLGPTCGRPLGLGFNYQTCELYIVDAVSGLVVVGPDGGLATPLATSAEGVPFGLPDALDVDQHTGKVYFTDTSSVYGIRYRFY